MQRMNFGRNVELHPRHSYSPHSEAEVLEILERHRGQQIRCVGRLHSWSRILEADEVLIDLQHLNQVTPLDGEQPSVVVGAGCQMKRLLSELLRLKNWTLPSVGFITEQSVAGAIATGTHGSGRHSLSHYVLSLRVAQYAPETGRATIVELSEGDALRAARCGLGCFGVVLSVQMQCRSTYAVEEHFREYRDLNDVFSAEQRFPLQQFYLVPWRWTYIAQHRRESNVRQSHLLRIYHLYRFVVFDLVMHLLILFGVRWLRVRSFLRALFRWIIPCFVPRGWKVSGPAQQQLVMEHELFRHIEFELFVRRSLLPAALDYLKAALTVADRGSEGAPPADFPGAAISEHLQQIAGTYCHHYPICIRKVLPDDTLLSMSSDDGSAPQPEAWYSITLTNYERGHRRQAFLALAEFLTASMAACFSARPHWGKLCTLSPGRLRALYPRFTEFQQLCDQADPLGHFRNAWTAELLNIQPDSESTVLEAERQSHGP